MLRFPFLLVRNIIALVIFFLMLPIYLLGQALRPRAYWVHLELQPRYPIAGPTGLARWFTNEQTFTALRQDVRRLAKDKRVKGVFLSWDGLQHGPASLADLREIFQILKDNGKEIVVHSEQLTTLDYPFANVANRILLTPAGRLFTFAPHIEMVFLGTLLERLGVHPQFVHIGAFKTASHRFLHSTAPIAQELMMTELLEKTKETLKSSIPNRDIEALLYDAPMDARIAAHRGLIDAEVFREDVVRYLHSEDHTHNPQPPSTPKPPKPAPMIGFPVWKESLLTSPWRPIFPVRNHIAVLDLSGMIVSPGMPASGPVISPQDVLPVLETLVMDPRVQGLILHINSPGGSALASEIIWRAIQQARREMPVVAWCSDVAASGGYYLACAADAIICRPESIIGSIGVITGKFTVADAAVKLGVGIQPLGEPSFLSMVDPLEGRLLENLVEDTRSFYRRFLDRVGDARKIPRHRLHRYARGRVYMGDAALERGLVDSVGGFEAAVAKINELLELPPNRTVLRPIPYQHQSFKDIARDSLMQSSGLTTLKTFESLSLEARVIQMFQKEPCLALSPLQITYIH